MFWAYCVFGPGAKGSGISTCLLNKRDQYFLRFAALQGVAQPGSASRHGVGGSLVEMREREFRGVAQPGSALAWGARGRWFESSHPDWFESRLNRGGFLHSIQLCTVAHPAVVAGGSLVRPAYNREGLRDQSHRLERKGGRSAKAPNHDPTDVIEQVRNRCIGYQ